LKKDLIIEFDQKTKKMEKRYCMYPMLGYQIPDKSDIGSYRENLLINNGVVDYGKFNTMYNFDNEPIKNNIVIVVNNIESVIFKKIFDYLSNIFCVVKSPLYYKKNVIFGNCDNYYKNDIIISNIVNNDDNMHIVDDYLKYTNKKNVFFVDDKNIEAVLCSVNLIKIYDVMLNLEEKTINVIHLSHSKERYKKFKNNNNIKNVNFIQAIKYEPLFLGCVLSNKMIINNAINQNLNYVQICEDDVVINDYSIIVKSIDYLNKNKKWNMLSCFNVDVNEEYKIKEIIQLDNKYKLLKLNNWCSTVFNIYNKNCFNDFMEYDENKVNLTDFDVNGNLVWTIDRKLKFDDIYLIYPYPVDIVNVKSEIWDDNNAYKNYINMKKKSYKILDSKIF
jgi:hypothetical protein